MSVNAEEALEMVETELISCSPISSVSSPTAEPSVIVCWCCRWLGFIISRAWMRRGDNTTPESLGDAMIFITDNLCKFVHAQNSHRILTMLSMFSLCVFISEASSLERWISSEKCLGFTETLLSCCWSIELNMTSKERGRIPGSLGVPVTV